MAVPVTAHGWRAPSYPGSRGCVRQTDRMVIVAGYLLVPAARRAEYLKACTDVVRAARSAPGCLDFALSADPLEDGRINVFERWQDAASVERFRGSGPDDGLSDLILGAEVLQHEVTHSHRL